MRLQLLAFATLCVWSVSLPSLAASPQYAGVDLYKPVYPDYYSGGISASTNIDPQYRLVAGEQFVNPVGSESLLWNGAGSSPVSLGPPGALSTQVLWTNGTQQLGSVNIPGLSGSSIWTGTPESHIILEFGAGVGVTAVSGNQQVGNDGILACLWSGTPESKVVLHPASWGNFPSMSYAVDTDGSQQVGYGSGSITNDSDHALVWSGTAESAVDLHPTHLDNFYRSEALRVKDGQQVGFAVGDTRHAMLWNGTADSAVDLNPSWASESRAFGTNGLQQIGDADGRAVVWSGTPESAIDLESLLPPHLFAARAFSIDGQGNIFGLAIDSGFYLHVVKWTPIPEPTLAGMLISCVLACAMAQRA